MTRRPRIQLTVAVVTAVALAGCSNGEPESPTTDPTEAAATPDLEATPSPSTSPDAPRPTSAMTIEDVAPPMSAAEIRVAEIIVEFDGEVTAEGTVLTLEEPILFDFDSAELKPSSADALDDIAEVLAYYQDAPVVIAGHTDSRGSDDYNRQLSQDRADAVQGALTDRDIDSSRLTAEGRGATEPVAPNEHDDGSDNPEGRAQNRRVEVLVVGVEPPDSES